MAERDRDWVQFATSLVVEETGKMRDALVMGANFLASIEPQPAGARVAAVKLLRAAKGCGLASADREYRSIRAEVRRKAVVAVQ